RADLRAAVQLDRLGGPDLLQVLRQRRDRWPVRGGDRGGAGRGARCQRREQAGEDGDHGEATAGRTAVAVGVAAVVVTGVRAAARGGRVGAPRAVGGCVHRSSCDGGGGRRPGGRLPKGNRI